MIIPVPVLWGRQRREPSTDRIDQVLYNRTHRLIAGLSIDDRFASVQGVLVVAIGHGKFIRLKHCIEVSAPIPTTIQAGCRAIHQSQRPDLSQFAPLLSDLAELQAIVVEKIKCHAGKYVDRVMAVAVVDPGVWTADFDQRISYSSFCDAARLAEQSGVNVIDDFPARDLTVGGRGQNLEALPWWLLAADRNERVSNCRRSLLLVGDSVVLYHLPASDGLDADLPAIERHVLADVHELEESLRVNHSEQPHELLIAAPREIEIALIQQFSQSLPWLSVAGISTLGFSSTAIPAVVASLLGLLHIDQMPANVPWLTGAASQRILGRLTPGRPANWRQLVRAMADFQPAAMKLKDAV